MLSSKIFKDGADVLRVLQPAVPPKLAQAGMRYQAAKSMASCLAVLPNPTFGIFFTVEYNDSSAYDVEVFRNFIL